MGNSASTAARRSDSSQPIVANRVNNNGAARLQPQGQPHAIRTEETGHYGVSSQQVSSSAAESNSAVVDSTASHSTLPSVTATLLSGGSRRPTRHVLESMVSNLANDLTLVKNRLRTAEEELKHAEVLKQQSEGSLPKTECIVCLNAQVSTVLIPCGHLCLCVACGELLQKSKPESTNCPLCREPVKQMHRVFLPIDELATPTPRTQQAEQTAVIAAAAARADGEAGRRDATAAGVSASAAAAAAAVPPVPAASASARAGAAPEALPAQATPRPTAAPASARTVHTSPIASYGDDFSMDTPMSTGSIGTVSGTSTGGSSDDSALVPTREASPHHVGAASPVGGRASDERSSRPAGTPPGTGAVGGGRRLHGIVLQPEEDKLSPHTVRAIGSMDSAAMPMAPRVLHARMQPNVGGGAMRHGQRVSAAARGVVFAPSVVDERGRLRPAAAAGGGGDENAAPEPVPDSFDFSVPGAWEPNPMLAATWG